MAGPYKQNGSGTLWVPNKADDKTEEAEALIESLKEAVEPENQENQWLGGYNKGDFKLDEMYINNYKDKTLDINGSIENVFVSLSIPIKNTEEMQKIAEQINKQVTIDKESSGLYLKPKDFSEVRTKTADAQGRINLGKEHSGEDVRVVIFDE